MARLNEYFIGKAANIKILNFFITDYVDLGLVLVDQYGNDLINEGNKYRIFPGNISPDELTNFKVPKVRMGSTSYLREIRNLEEYVKDLDTLDRYKYLLDGLEVSIEDAINIYRIVNRRDEHLKKFKFVPK